MISRYIGCSIGRFARGDIYFLSLIGGILSLIGGTRQKQIKQ